MSRAFYAFARERYSIYLKREAGLPPPWTVDPILQKYRFCNIFREDDKTTAWFREKIRQPLRNSPLVVPATIVFRWFNRIEIGEILLPALLTRPLDTVAIRTLLRDVPPPYTTGAFIVSTPSDMKKLDGLCWCFRQVEQWLEKLPSPDSWISLQVAHHHLMNIPYLGSFMAYEIVTDLRHTRFLETALDIDTWAAAGPGAARGLQYIYGQPYNYFSRKDQEKMNARICELLALSRVENLWPAEWPRWEMREVEHQLCEFAKYQNAKAGKRLKRRYQPCT